MRTVAECLAVIGWNNSVFANRLNVSPRWAIRLKNDPRTECPWQVLEWLNKLADAHDQNPFPKGWRL